MDDVQGVLRLIHSQIPIDMNSGLVRGINANNAEVSITGADQQTCSFDPSMIVSVGDEVILARTRRTQQWSIIAVINRRSRGLSNNSRETPNNRAGAPRFAPATTVNLGSKTASSATAVSIYSQTFTFNGGRPMVIVNGYATIPVAAALSMGVGVDQVSSTHAYNNTVGATAAAINFTWLHSEPLNGLHTIYLSAWRTGANNAALTIPYFSILEV